MGRASLHLCGDEVLVPFPESLARVGEGAYVPVNQTAPWFLEEGAVPAIVEDFLAAGTPPLFFGLGSMPGPPDFPRVFAAAAGRLGHRAIIADVAPGAGATPDVLYFSGELPHREIFSRCAGIIHHGGAGTTIAAAGAGVPQVVLPLVADQYFHAHLVGRRRLGPRAIPRKGLEAENLAMSIRFALEQSDFAAIANQSMIATTGVAEAVAIVQRLVTT